MGLHVSLELLKGAVQQGDIRLGGVVLILHAGAADDRALRELFEDGLGDFDLFAEGAFQVFQCNVAGAEEGGLIAHDRHDRGLHAPVALAAVQNQGQTAVHIGEDVLCVGWAGFAGQVGRRGRKGAAAGLDDRTGHGVAGHPDADGVQTGAALRRHLRAARHDDGQRAGAERRHEQLCPLRHLADEAGQHLRAGDVDDQGVILRAALGHKDFCHSFPIAGIGCDAVDRLRGQGHQLAAPQQRSRFRDALALGG